MALDPIAANAPVQTYARINAAITALNTLQTQFGTLNTDVTARALQADFLELVEDVAGKAGQAQVNDLVGAVSARATVSAFNALSETVSKIAIAVGDKAGQQQVTELVAAVQRKADQAELDDVVDTIARINSGLYSKDRPGDTPNAFTASRAGGLSDDLPPVSLQNYRQIVGPEGVGLELTASRELFARRYEALKSGRLHRAYWRFLRSANPADPDGDAIRMSILWFDANKQPHATFPEQVVEDKKGLLASDGAYGKEIWIGTAGMSGIDIVRPTGAVYYRLGIKAFGLEQTTLLTDMHADDISDIGAAALRLLPPDAVPVLGQRIDNLSVQVSDLASLIGSASGDAQTAYLDTSRPGDALAAFVGDIAGGEPGGKQPLTSGSAVTADRGRVYQMAGAKVLGTRRVQALEDGRVYEFRGALQGNGATGKFIRIGLVYLDSPKAPLTGDDFGVAIREFPNGLTPADGRVAFSATISRTSTIPGVSITTPAAAVHVIGFVQTSTGEAGLDVEVLDLVDITDAHMARVSADRGGSAEGRRLADLSDASMQSVVARPMSSDTPFGTTGFTGWGMFDLTTTDDVVDGFWLPLNIPAGVSSFDVLVVERGGTDTSDTELGKGVNDTILTDIDPRVSFKAGTVINQAHFKSEECAGATISFGRPLYRRVGFLYGMMLRARLANGSLAFVGVLPSDMTGQPRSVKGWAYGPTGALVPITGAIGAAGRIFRRQAALPVLPAVAQYRGAPRFSGLTLDLGSMTRVDRSGVRLVPSGKTVHAACTVGTGARKSITLKGYTQTDFLDHANISNVGVTDNETGRVLTYGTEYVADPSGRIYAVGVPTPADRAVSVAYDWANEAIDLVCEVPSQGTLVVIPGVERAHTAHEEPYRPKLTDEGAQIPLFYVRKVGAAIVEVLPAWDWIGTFSAMRQPEIDAVVSVARSRLQRTLTKLLRGDGLQIAFYGDSNTQCGGGAYVNATSFEPNRNNAQGATDLIGFGGDFYDKATSEADFRSWFAANCPSVMINGAPRYKAGPHWRLIDMLCRDFGYTLAPDRDPGPFELGYLNFGLGATTMEATAGNMGDPARLTVLCDPSAYGPQPGGFRTPDLIVIQAGMNGTPDPNFPSQLGAVIKGIQQRAPNADILVYGMHRTNDEGSPANRFSPAAWKRINVQIGDVCMRRGVAYLPSDLFEGEGAEGFMGLSAAQMCRTNYLNHPGPWERKKKGEVLCMPFTAGSGIGSFGGVPAAQASNTNFGI